MIEKKIKAINERLSVYEKKGLSSTTAYKKLITDIERSGLATTKSKSGNLRISRAKSNLNNNNVKTRYGNTMKKSDLINSLLKNKTVGDLKKEARNTFENKPSEKELINRVLDIDKNKEFIYSHLSEWYLLFSSYANENSKSIKDFNMMVSDMIKDTTQGVKEMGESFLDNAPDYIKKALESDI